VNCVPSGIFCAKEWLYCLAGINEKLPVSLFSTLLVNPTQQQYSRTHDYAALYEY
jgi:hypothetical protein